MRAKELIEISRILGGVTTDTEKFKHYFKNSTHHPAIYNLTFSEIKNEYDSHFLGLFDNNNLISCIQLDFREYPYIQLTNTITNKEWRRKGCFRYLISKAISIYTHVLSDDAQTNNAEEAWKGLINNPGNLKIDMYDTTKNSFVKLDLNKVWDHKYAFLLHATM